MARNYAALFHAYLEEFADLTDAEFGRLVRALLVYSSTGEFPALSGNERFFKRRVMMQEDQVRGSYESAAEKSRTNGKNGGRPKKPRETQNNPEEPRETQNNPENLNRNRNRNRYKALDISNDISREYTRARESAVVPPSFEEVCEYNRLRGSLIDPKPFFDYYDAASWRDSEGKPVYNWQQKLIAWEMRELEKQRTKNEKQQRGGNIFLEMLREEEGGTDGTQ